MPTLVILDILTVVVLFVSKVVTQVVVCTGLVVAFVTVFHLFPFSFF